VVKDKKRATNSRMVRFKDSYFQGHRKVTNGYVGYVCADWLSVNHLCFILAFLDVVSIHYTHSGSGLAINILSLSIGKVIGTTA
jgi:hypothetical protein